MYRILLLLTLVSMPLHSHAIEEPAYEVIRSFDKVELRQYAPYVVAEVELAASAEDAGNQAFPILAGYIFGKNKGERRFAMTAPVTQVPVPVKLEMSAPVTQSVAPGGFLVQFVLPKGVTVRAAASIEGQRCITSPCRKSHVCGNGDSTLGGHDCQPNSCMVVASPSRSLDFPDYSHASPAERLPKWRLISCPRARSPRCPPSS